MSRKNFRNPKTGKEFTVSQFKSKGDGKYYDRWGKLLTDEDGTPLELIPKEGPIGAPAQLGSKQEQYDKQQKHFKARAKKHARSEESKALKRKVMDREFGNMGLERKK